MIFSQQKTGICLKIFNNKNSCNVHFYSYPGEVKKLLLAINANLNFP